MVEKNTCYVASKFENVGPVREAHALLRAAGWEVSYDWTQATDVDLKRFSPAELETFLEQQAQADYVGVTEADAFLILGYPGMRGGFVELGLALNAVGTVHVVGREHVKQIFLHLSKSYADIYFHDSIATAIAAITRR